MLDSSALLAVLNLESGADQVVPLLDGSAISAVNWSETFQKALARDVRTEALRRDVESLGVTIVPFRADEAEQAARAWLTTSAAGLSLGDRACLTLAEREGIVAVTADRAWSRLSTTVQMRIIR